ncbi:MAG: TIGR02302 family protein [Rhodospirillaceae bacterium]
MSDLNEFGPDIGKPRRPAHLGLHRAIARLSLFWESAWPALWPAAGIALLFLTLALLDVFPLLPGWFHGLILAGFATLFVWQFHRGLRRIRPPSAAAATRRLETDAGLAHRPLTVIEDRPVVGVVDPETERLWQRHVAQAAAAARGLRLRWPRPQLAERDPYALRIALGVLLTIGVVAAGEDANRRIDAAFSPDLRSLANANPPSLELWITPPDYTNLPPRLLASADPKSAARNEDGRGLEIPVGSTLLAQVSQARRAPVLAIGEQERELEPVGGENWRIEAALDATGPQILQLEASGRDLGTWEISVLPDTAPTISFVESPQGTASSTLQISYDGADDHGIVDVTAEITWPGEPENTTLAPVSIELPLPNPDPRAGSAVSVHDLTEHPWAGLEVDIRLTATDGRGQTGQTDRLAVLLPERTFNHPVARAIVEQRRVLAQSPDSRREVARSLHNIGAIPQRFDNDVVVFLALMSARSRLVHMHAGESVLPILSQLWDTALRLEDGALSLTERELAELQQQLRDALENGASEEEIQELLEEYRAALDRYLEALAQNLSQALEGMDLSTLPEAGDDANLVDREAIQQMLDQIEQMARLGDTESVEQLLERMQQMLQALRDAPNQLQQQSASPAQEMLRELQDIVRRQQELQDDLFQRNQRGERLSEEEAQRLRDAQNEVRRQLGEMMRRLGEMTDQIPENLGNAEDAMGDAENAIEGGDLPGALGDQARALAELQQGAQSMALQLLRQPGQGQGPGQQQGGVAQPGQEGFDPLGRELGDQEENPDGFFSQDSGREVGDGEQARRALEILDELRNRALDRTRPSLERDYLERLLRRF